MVGDDLAMLAAKGKAASSLALDMVTIGKPVIPVRQGLNRCGPASMEAITRMIGLSGYEQKQIARDVLFLPKRVDWHKFPGLSLPEIKAYLTNHPDMVGKLHKTGTFAEAEALIQASLQKNRPVLAAINVDLKSPEFVKGLVTHSGKASATVPHWIVIHGYSPSKGTYKVYDSLSHTFGYELSAAKLARKWNFDVPGKFDFLAVGRR